LLLWFLGVTYNNLINQTNLISSFRFLPSLIVLLTVLVRLFVKCLTTNKETILFSRLITLFSILFFLSNNLFTFYLFFEIRIIPILFLILGFGYQTERIQAATYLLVYTILCSFPFIFLIFKILQTNWTLYLFGRRVRFSFFIKTVLLLVFFVKLPLFLLHSWLPKAHVEAPTIGSVLLAAILLKLGGFGVVQMFSLFKVYEGVNYFIYFFFCCCFYIFFMLFSKRCQKIGCLFINCSYELLFNFIIVLFDEK